jgi:predicted RecA/RadA family phage recombinase
MATNFIQKGDRMDYTNGGASTITSGSPVLVSKTLGVAVKDIPAGQSEALHIEGVFEIRKAHEAISQGDNLYWDADGNPEGAAAGNGLSGTGCLTATLSGNVYAGKAFAAAALTDATVQIKLNV